MSIPSSPGGYPAAYSNLPAYQQPVDNQPTKTTTTDNQPTKTPKYVKVNESVQKWANIVLHGKPEVESNTYVHKKDRSLFKSAVYYTRYQFTTFNINFDGRSDKKRTEDAYLRYGLIGLVAGTVAFFFWLADYNQVNHRMDKVEKGIKSLNKSAEVDSIIKVRFNDAMTMLEIQKSRLQYKLAASGGLLGFSASMVVGAVISSSALMAIGGLGALFTLLAVTAHTLTTRRSFVYCAPEKSVYNWFPLNWIPKTERNAARDVLGEG